jgi:exonuclease VII small subunit
MSAPINAPNVNGGGKPARPEP